MKNCWILKGRGLNFKRQLVDLYVAELYPGGCRVVESESEAQRFTYSEAYKAIQGRHACSGFKLIEAEPVATVNEEQFVEYDAYPNPGEEYSPADDINHKYYGMGKPVTPAPVSAVSAEEVALAIATLKGIISFNDLSEWKMNTPKRIRDHRDVNRVVGATWKRLDAAWWKRNQAPDRGAVVSVVSIVSPAALAA